MTYHLVDTALYKSEVRQAHNILASLAYLNYALQEN